MELSCFLEAPTDVGNLISGSSAFSKFSLNIWKFTTHILLKPGLENFKHYFTSNMWTMNFLIIFMKKASGSDGIPVRLFQILKDDVVKVLHSICQQIWKTQQWPQNCKMSVFVPIPKKHNAKECSNYHTVSLISHATKVILKILQARLQQYVNSELPDVQAGFRKGTGTRDQIAIIHWIIKKAREFQKNIYLCFIDYAKVFV